MILIRENILISIDKTYKIFESNASVLDLGSAPGSWMQYSSQKVGRKGLVIGIDLLPINTQFIKDNSAFCNFVNIQNDIFQWDYLSELAQIKNDNKFLENFL